MKAILVTWDAGGNVPPFLGLSRELSARGHEVVGFGSHGMKQAFVEAGARYVTSVDGEVFRPLARLTVPQSTQMQANIWLDRKLANEFIELVEREKPDVLVVDCCLNAVQVAAETTGVPLVVLIHTLLGRLLPHWDRTYLPAINEIREEYGLRTVQSTAELWNMGSAALVASLQRLDELPDSEFASRFKYIGPIFEPGDGKTNGYKRGDLEKPLVTVSFSTTFMEQEEPIANVLKALSELECQAVVTTGPSVDPAIFPTYENISLHQWMPHADILPHAAVAIVHGGHSTACKALWFGVPILVMPLGRDQRYVGERVADVGAGLILDKNSSPAEISAAVSSLLSNLTFREGAKEIAREMRSLGGSERGAADILEDIIE